MVNVSVGRAPLGEVSAVRGMAGRIEEGEERVVRGGGTLALPPPPLCLDTHGRDSRADCEYQIVCAVVPTLMASPLRRNSQLSRRSELPSKLCAFQPQP